MNQLFTLLPDGFRGMRTIEDAVRASGVPHKTLELIKIRASQINGCAFCLDMHHKDAQAEGETAERLYMLPAWREAKCYTDAERAALALTEAVTRIADQHVPADVEDQARRHFDDKQYAALVFGAVAINAWNRLAIAGHAEPGTYQR